MSAAPENLRAARIAIPRLPFPAILLFAITGLGGALFLVYTSSFPSADPIRTLASSDDEVPVYSVAAVPFESPPEAVAARAIAGAQTATSAPREPGHSEPSEIASESASPEPALLSEANRELKGFNRFSNLGPVNNYLALTESTFGMIAQMNAPSYVAPDAEAISAPVPEPSTWVCGVALLALLLTRGLHASWHRHQRRSANKTNSGRP